MQQKTITTCYSNAPTPSRFVLEQCHGFITQLTLTYKLWTEGNRQRHLSAIFPAQSFSEIG